MKDVYDAYSTSSYRNSNKTRLRVRLRLLNLISGVTDQVCGSFSSLRTVGFRV